MSQSRILSFFSTVSDAEYDEQLHRDREQHFVEREAEALHHSRARQRREREQGRAALQQTEEQKVEAMSLCMSEPNQVLGEEPEVEVDADSDGEEEEEVEGVDCEGPPED